MAAAAFTATVAGVSSLHFTSHSYNSSSSSEDSKVSLLGKGTSNCFRSSIRGTGISNAKKLAPLSLTMERNSRDVCIIRANATQIAQEARPSSQREMTTVEVDLGDRTYPIYIGSGLLDQPDLLQRHVKGRRVLVVTNTTVGPLYLDKVVAALTHGGSNISVESVILPDGEKYKEMVVMAFI